MQNRWLILEWLFALRLTQTRLQKYKEWTIDQLFQLVKTSHLRSTDVTKLLRHPLNLEGGRNLSRAVNLFGKDITELFYINDPQDQAPQDSIGQLILSTKTKVKKKNYLRIVHNFYFTQNGSLKEGSDQM